MFLNIRAGILNFITNTKVAKKPFVLYEAKLTWLFIFGQMKSLNSRPYKNGFEKYLMRQYFIYDGHLKKGPFYFEQLKSKSLSRETPVWYEGMEDWALAANLNELKEYFILKATPPPLPKDLENNTRSRNEILNSFTDAEESVHKPSKKSFIIPIIIFALTVAVIIALFFMPIKIK